MKSLIALSLAALLMAGCSGSQDYKSLPQTDDGPITGYNPNTNTTTRPRVEVNSSGHPAGVLSSIEPEEGHLWKGLEWAGMDEKTVNNIRCSYGDSTGIRTADAFGAALGGGAIIGVITRVSGSVFFGKPADPHHHGHNGHHDNHAEVAQKTLWSKINTAVRSGFGAAFGGAVAVGLCQTILAGGNWTSFDGLLGQDFQGLSAALAVGAASTMAVSPWVRKFFAEPELTPEQEAALKQQAEEAQQAKEEKAAKAEAARSQPDLPYGESLHSLKPGDRGFGARMRNLVDWPATGQFVKGTWYKFAPSITVLGISTGVGVLVYHDLHEKAGYEAGYLPPNCVPLE